MRVLITGSRGFIGANLAVRLREVPGTEVLEFVRADLPARLNDLVGVADAIVHLAGVNRPKDLSEFASGNIELTRRLCDAIAATTRAIPLLVASSVQAELDNPYGRSKLAAENLVQRLASQTGCPVVLYRLPGVFGKWCKPNYNSVVATFCHNIATGSPIEIKDPSTAIELVYIDDVVSDFMHSISVTSSEIKWGNVAPRYSITLGELAEQISSFGNCRTTLISERVGSGLVRALYATYVSYLPTSKFAYDLPRYADSRGVFVEMLKTRDSGQFSYFTAGPGVTRGGHYHHSKTEKFLVISGHARFGFRHLLTNQEFELFTAGDKPKVVESVPGWTHDITNVGSTEMVVMLWASELFDRTRPDTVTSKVHL